MAKSGSYSVSCPFGDMSGQVAFITGGGQGLGRMHALTLAGLGCDIVLLDVNADGLARTAFEIKKLGRRALVFAGRVEDASFMSASVESVIAEVGRIDILINNAGVSGQYLSIEEIDAALLLAMLNVHVVGAFTCVRAVVPQMKQQRAGRIINTASTWGMVGNEISSHYCAAKASLLGATKAWAKELAPFGIRVNAIAPGWIDTNRWTAEKRDLEAANIPLGRFGTPEEVSALVAYLVSPAAAFMSGQVISLNGAQTIT